MNYNLFKNLTTWGLLNIALFANLIPNNPALSITAPSNQEFTLIAGNQVFLNSGGNFEGDPNDPNDDALIYAHNGFTMNNLSNVILPTKKDQNGNILKDSNNLKVLVDYAVAVNSSNPQINAPNNVYSGLTTPPQTSQIVNLPDYDTLKSEEKNKRNTSNNVVNFNSGANPINNLTDWANKFPAPGTVNNPTVVNVTGGLTIPGGVNLSNYIITVDGTINFNGTSTISNVVLISNSGGLNLGSTQFNNSAIFAPGVINMNSTARFSGDSLIASLSDVNFDGATTTTNETDELRVISQGTITYNASLNSRAKLISAVDVNFNANTILYGYIWSQDDIRCNSSCGVVGVEVANNTPNPTPDPILFAD